MFARASFLFVGIHTVMAHLLAGLQPAKCMPASVHGEGFPSVRQLQHVFSVRADTPHALVKAMDSSGGTARALSCAWCTHALCTGTEAAPRRYRDLQLVVDIVSSGDILAPSLERAAHRVEGHRTQLACCTHAVGPHSSIMPVMCCLTCAVFGTWPVSLSCIRAPVQGHSIDSSLTLC